ncbi:MAG: restriction endonuclease [Candidatus Aureabacteria bacterium]|nr:restriction endonuclease [Candidatus Auribacterota bacterium]
MPIPDYQTLMLPLLKFASDEKEHSLREAIDSLANQFDLTDEERKELLPSGQQEIFDNRIGWARTYVKKAGLLESKRRGYFQITPKGLKVLSGNPERIDINFLNQYPEFQEFRTLKKDRIKKTKEIVEEETPEEILETAYIGLRNNLVNELLQQVKDSAPSFFEKLVVELLVKMGYGGSRKDAGQAVGKTKDEGIDGIIKEDRLGLDIIYIQAKRWGSVVGRPEIQKFAGALQGKRARKGIFITTSTFTKDALDYVANIDNKIILIDGNQIAQFMIDCNIGVSSVATYEIKKIDSDYFNEE